MTSTVFFASALTTIVASTFTSNATYHDSISQLKNWGTCPFGKFGDDPMHFPSDPLCQQATWTRIENADSMFNETSNEDTLSLYTPGSSTEIMRQAALKLPSRQPLDLLESFEPTEEQIFRVFGEDADYTQIIFGHVELKEREKKQGEDFLEWLDYNELPLPFGLTDVNNRQHIRFQVNEQHLPFETIYQQLTTTEEYQRNDILKLIDNYETDSLHFMRQGAVYILGRDNDNRPISYVNLRRCFDLGMSIQQIMDASDVMAAWMMAYAFVPGKVETMTTIMDYKDVSLLELPIIKARKPCAHYQLIWRQRLGTGYVINVPVYMRIPMVLVYTFMTPETSAKLSIVGGKADIRKTLGKVLNLDVLEKKYGGNLPDHKDDFWPPHLHL